MSKENYRQVSALSSISKGFETLIQGYINGYRNIFYIYILTCAAVAEVLVHSQNYYQYVKVEKRFLGNNDFGGAVCIDLSKAFDTINHEFLIAKLHACDLDKAVSSLFFIT